MSTGAKRHKSWPIGLFSLFGLIVAALLFSGCFFQEQATPTPNPYLIPGTEEVEYRDDELGFSFRHPDDWLVSDSPDPTGIIVSMVSPDQSVTIDVERDLPPPQIDFMSYGNARMRFFQQLQPGLMILEETETTLTDGNPAYHANWVSRSETGESKGETLVVFRGEGDDREVFMIVSAGPTGLYNAWTGPILFFYESLSIDQAAS